MLLKNPINPSAPRTRAIGYALIEVVIAMIVSAVTIGALVSALTTSQRALKEELQRTQALAACEAQIENLRYLWETGQLNANEPRPPAPESLWATMSDPRLIASYWFLPTQTMLSTGQIATLYQMFVEVSPCLDREVERQAVMATGREFHASAPIASGVRLSIQLASSELPIVP